MSSKKVCWVGLGLVAGISTASMATELSEIAPAQFFVEQPFSEYGSLHYGALSIADEQHHYGGLSLGELTIGAFHAEAHTVSEAQNTLYPGLDQTFFYGGTRAEFQVQGITAEFPLGGGVQTQVASAQVSAAGVAPRYGNYVGLQRRGVEVGGFQLSRGSEPVGHGLNLALDIGGFELAYQAVESEFDASLRRVALLWQPASRWDVSIAVERARNNQFTAANEDQIFFSVERYFGAADDREDRGFNRVIGLGVGVGLAAAAVSSGSSDRDGAPRFLARDEAAFEVLNAINPVSVAENREHGGWIYVNADNSFSYTEPVAGTANSVNIGSPFNSVPEGTLANASYHTHGGPDPRFINEQFSPQDLFFNRLFRLDGYLGTPAGFMKLHDVRTEQIFVLGRISN